MTIQHLPVFLVNETHRRALRAENRLLADSERVGWRSLYAAILEEAPLDVREAPIPHPSLIYHLCRPTAVARRIEGMRLEKALIGPRRFCITPGGVTAQWEHHGNPEILQIYVRNSIYDNAVQEMYGWEASKAPLLPRFAILDPLLEQLAVAIATALREGTAEDGLYVDTLAHMMAVHLARRHSEQSRISHQAGTRSVSGSRIKRLIEFVEENLDRDLSLQTMAHEAGVSAFYLPRAFKSAMGQSPHQYVLARRIERARDLLRNTDLPIVDVALASGFGSQSHLSNWFVRVVGIPPAAYRREQC